MPTSTLGTRGRITIPKRLRQRLALQPGDRLELRLRGDGVLELEPLGDANLGRVPGLLHHLDKEGPVSLDEMEEGIRRHVAKEQKELSG